MTVAIWIAVAILGVSILLGLIRIITATDGASRAIVGDLVFFCAIGVLLLVSVKVESAAIIDAAMLAALLGILATIALSRILTRGHR
jgi:multicomponent Na+:H+ antiporter subunit F